MLAHLFYAVTQENFARRARVQNSRSGANARANALGLRLTTEGICVCRILYYYTRASIEGLRNPLRNECVRVRFYPQDY